MTYQALPTVTTGETWTAAQHNTYVRDNFSALFPYTKQGNIAYAASASELTVPTNAAGIKIMKSVSGVPAWVDPPSRSFCFITKNNQNVEDGSENISFSTEVFDNFNMWSSGSPTNISLPSAGIYRFVGTMVWASNNDGRRAVILNDGSNIYIDSRLAISGLYTVNSFSYVYYTSTAKTVNIIAVQNSGVTLATDCSLMVTYLGDV
jgi:hypothetical protein